MGTDPALLRSEPPLRVVHLISGDLWAGAEVQACTLLHHLRKRQELEVSAIVLNRGTLTSRLQDLGIPVSILAEDELSLPSLLIQLRKRLRQAPPDILHTHRYKETVLGAVALTGLRRPAMIRTQHGLPEPRPPWKRLKSSVYEWLQTAMTRRYFSAAIGVSEEVAASLRQALPRLTVMYIPNGMDPLACQTSANAPAIRTELRQGGAGPVIGTAGRLVAVKGLDILLEAAKRLEVDFPGLRVYVAGDGPLREALQAECERLGLAGVVRFLGHRSDVHDVIAGFDVFVLSSLSEGLPMVLLEAMALGTPIAASRVGGVLQLLRDEDTALLVEPRDPVALAAACGRLIRDRELGTRLAANARQSLSARFSAALMADRVLDLYRSILK